MGTTRADKRINVLVGNNAKAIFDHLTEQANNPTNHERRWFWELLQNAKDSKDQDLDVKLEICENEVVFKHNGKAFSEDDILHIIYYGSTKAQLEGKTGKFGTGFLTTHLLSMKVTVEGYLDNGNYFNFILDRHATDELKLKDKLDECYNSFYKSSESGTKVEMGEFKTVFKYHINAQGHAICNKGLDDLKMIAPFVLAFNQSIRSIGINQQGNIWSIKRTSELDRQKSFQSIHTVVGDQENPLEFNVLVLNSGKFDLAFKLDGDHSLDKLPDNVPRLFLDFPLFGSEDLGIPFIINSRGFHPLKERVGIYLNTENENSLLAKKNAELIIDAFVKYKDFIENCKEANYGNLEHLFGFKRSYSYDWNDEDFFNDQITDSIQFLLGKDLILLRYDDDKKPIFSSVEKIDLPTPDKNKDFDIDKFFRLTKTLDLSSVPSENIWRALLEYRMNWKPINRNFDSLPCDWTIASVLAEIASFESIIDMIEHYSFPSEEIFFDWLNDIFDLVKVSSAKESINNTACMPDQQGKFKKCAPGQLFFDEVGGESLKDIAHLSTYEVRTFLVHSKIARRHDDLFVKYDTKELLNKLLDILLNKRQDFGKIHEADKNSLVLLLDWAFENTDYFSNIVSKLPFIFATNEDELNKYEPRMLNKDEKVLIPAAMWPENLQLYSRLVSAKFLLSPIYNSILNSSQRIALLEDTGFFFISPIYYEDDKFKREELKFMTDASDTKKLMEHTDKLDFGTVRLAKLAWFESGDSLSVLQRQSKKRTQLIIEFLLKYLIYADSSWDTRITLASNPDLKLSVLSSYWLCKLNTNKWMYSSSGNETPDANNISIYLKEMGYQEALKNQIVTKFLNALKLPVSDIIKQVLIKNEADSVAWDTVYASMVQGNVPANEVGEIIQDNDVIAYYHEKKANAQKAGRNKDIGDKFEKELESIFRSETFASLGFKIKREPIGSDFVAGMPPEDVVPEEDIFAEDYNGGAVFVLEGDDKFFLELKATSGNSVSMTKAQAKKATGNIKNYCLAIFKYDSQEDINTENILNKSIFIDTIGTELVQPFKRHTEIESDVEVEKSGTDISVESEFGRVRFRINQPIWARGKTMDEFIENFTSNLKKQTVNA